MAAFCSQPKRCVFLGYGGYAEATEGQEDCIGYGYAVEAPALLNRQCSRVQGWRCFFWVEKLKLRQTEAAKGSVKKLGGHTGSFSHFFLVEDARSSQRKLVMSLKWIWRSKSDDFCRNPK